MPSHKKLQLLNCGTIERDRHIDIAKGLCIVLVVIGHFNPSVELEWWEILHDAVYSLHMPAFMFLSGLLYAKTYRRDEDYLHFLGRKARHLLFPYFTTSVFIIGSKLLVQDFLPVRNTFSLFSFVEMFYYPCAAIHLWFLWTLFWIFVIVGGVRTLRRHQEAVTLLLLCFSVLMWFIDIPLPKVFCISLIRRMLVYFLLGCYAARFRQETPALHHSKATAAAITAVFACCETAYLHVGMETGILAFITELSGVAFVMVISSALAKCATWVRNPLCVLGRYSFVIYLFHTIVTEPAKLILDAAGLSLEDHSFLVFALTVTAGVVFPMLAQKFVIDRFRILRILFGSGVSPSGRPPLQKS